MNYIATRVPLDDAIKLQTELNHLIEAKPLHNALFSDILTRLVNCDDHRIPPALARITDDSGKLVGGLIHTPPFKVILTHPFPLEAVGAVARLFSQDDQMTPMNGVNCECGVAEALRDAILQLPEFRHLVSHVETQLRLHQLTVNDLILPSGHKEGSNGNLRKATLDDAELVGHWADMFQKEINSPANLDAMRHARGMIEESCVYLWEVEGKPVSMVAVRGRAAKSPRVGWVFTPKEMRSKGYASNCVAGVCKAEFEESAWPQLTLFTDLTNPTSNKVYKSIGFVPVQDQVCFEFREPGP